MTVQANINWRWIRSDANSGRFGHPGCNTSTFPSQSDHGAFRHEIDSRIIPDTGYSAAWHCTCYLTFQIDAA